MKHQTTFSQTSVVFSSKFQERDVQRYEMSKVLKSRYVKALHYFSEIKVVNQITEYTTR